MSNYRKIHYTDLVCLNCGHINTIQRVDGHFRNIGHIKDMYCHICQSTEQHYEVQDADLFKLKYEGYLNKTLTSDTNEILNIIKGKEENERRKHKVLTKTPTSR